ncbi:MAG: hypothetical protein Q8R36_05800 [bacterium]|nr:hypothetical protein [bacterium]
MEMQAQTRVKIGTIVEGKTVAKIGKVYFQTNEAEKRMSWRKNIPVKFTDGTCGIVVFFEDDCKKKMSLRMLGSPIGRKLLEKSTKVPTIWYIDDALHIGVETPEAEDGFSTSVRIEFLWRHEMDLDPNPDVICRFAKCDR